MSDALAVDGTSAKSLQPRLKVFVVSILCLLLLGQLVGRLVANRKAQHAKVIDVAGRQRMVAERIARLGLLAGSASGERSQELRERLRTVTDQWLATQDRLNAGDLNYIPIPTDAAIAQIARDASAKQDAMVELVRRLCQVREVGELSAESVAQDLATLAPQFVEKMNEVGAFYEQESERRIAPLVVSEYMLVLIEGLAVLWGAALLLHPVFRRVEEECEKLSTLTGSLEEAKFQLIDERAELKSHVDAQTRRVETETERLQLALDTAGAGIWEWELDSNTCVLDERVARILGFEGTFSCEVARELVHPEDVDVFEAWVYALRSGSSIEQMFVRAGIDGSRVYVLVRGVRDAASGVKGRVTGICIDVSERFALRRSLRRSEERFETTFEEAAVGMALVSLEGAWLMANTTLCAILGYSLPELLATDFQSITHPEDLDDDLRLVEELLAGARTTYAMEKRYVRRDGNPVWCRLSVSLARNDDGVPMHFISVVEDIDVVKRAEHALELLNETLESEVAQRTEELARSNEELGQFAYVASHDLQEPLRVMSSYIQLIEEQYKDRLDESGREFMGFVVDACQRMKRLITDLLAYSRVGRREIELHAVSLADVMDIVQANLGTAIEESGAVVSRGELPEVVSNDGQLIQLLQNLVKNAIVYRGETPPSIRVDAIEEDLHWKVLVSDNGIGLDPKFEDRIFMIFQRLHTREEYQGTGIGLAICKKIANRLGGDIGVDSEVGRGSTFYFTLPKRIEAVS